MNVKEFAPIWEKVLDKYEEEHETIPDSTNKLIHDSRKTIARAKELPERAEAIQISPKDLKAAEQRFVTLLGWNWKEKIK